MYLQTQKNSSEIFFVRRREHKQRLSTFETRFSYSNGYGIKSDRLEIMQHVIRHPARLVSIFGKRKKDTIKIHRQEAQFELKGPEVVLCVLR